MLRLLRFLWTGDFHLCKLEIIQESLRKDEVGNVLWTRRYCRCQDCGIIKVFDPD